MTKSKESDKYLGDIIHRDGLAASVEATIRDRKGRITSATLEIKAVIDDYRMQALGGYDGRLGLVEHGSGTEFAQQLFNLDWNIRQAGGHAGDCAGEVHQADAGGANVYSQGGIESRDWIKVYEA